MHPVSAQELKREILCDLTERTASNSPTFLSLLNIFPALRGLHEVFPLLIFSTDRNIMFY